MQEGIPFQFKDPGILIEGNLELVLVQKSPAIPVMNYVPSYVFEMRPVKSQIRLGGISLRIGRNEWLEMYAGHIGYSVEPEFRGNRYAARSCQLIRPLAHSHGIDPIWITCSPENDASRRSIEIIGATYVETVDVPKNTNMYRQGEVRKRRYRWGHPG